MSRCRHCRSHRRSHRRSDRRSHRAAATALPPSRCAPPPRFALPLPQRRRQAAANVALSRYRHRLAAAKLPPTSRFRAAATAAAVALLPSRCCRRRRAAAKLPPTSRCRAATTRRRRATVRWLVVALLSAV
jgi:hypothetical protein